MFFFFFFVEQMMCGDRERERESGSLTGPGSVDGAALEDAAPGQVAADGRQQVDADGTGAGALAEQRQLVGIAAEAAGVVLDPLDGQRLVVEAHVARRLVRAQVQEAEGADAVVERRHDDVVVAGQQRAVVELQRRRAAHVAAAVDPDQHRRSLRRLLVPIAVINKQNHIVRVDLQTEML